MLAREQTKLIGYDSDFNELLKIFNESNLPNKIIFSGNKGIGKSTLVYHFINYIFSMNEEFSYDSKNKIINKENKSYKLVNNLCHPNFFKIEISKEKKNIDIAQIREMILFTNKSSLNNNFKIILIDNVEYLNKNSTNALLKVVEEPNSKVLFFLIHDISKNILSTLKSRCINFRLNLNKKYIKEIVDAYFNDNYYDYLNPDFLNHYFSPSNYINLILFCIENNLDYKKMNVDDLIKYIIFSNINPKSKFIKENFIEFLQLFFLKKAFSKKDKKIFYFYNYFINQLDIIKKYNLDFESFYIDFKSKFYNG